MNTIRANSLNEMQKLQTKKSTKLFLLASMLIPVLTKLLVNNLFFTNWMALPAENINFTLLDLFVTIFFLYLFLSPQQIYLREKENAELYFRLDLLVEWIFSYPKLSLLVFLA
jgi:ABC-2 type transport system permease protein